MSNIGKKLAKGLMACVTAICLLAGVFAMSGNTANGAENATKGSMLGNPAGSLQLGGVSYSTNFGGGPFYLNGDPQLRITLDTGNTVRSGDQIVIAIPDVLDATHVVINGFDPAYGTFSVNGGAKTATITFSRDMGGIGSTTMIVNFTPAQLGTAAISASYVSGGTSTKLDIPNLSLTIVNYNYEDRTQWIVGGDAGTINDVQRFNSNYLGSHTFLPNQASMIYYTFIDPSGNQSALTGRTITYKPDTRAVSAGSSLDVNYFWVSKGAYENNPQYVKLANSGWKYTVNADGSIVINVPDGKTYYHYAITYRIFQKDVNKEADALVYPAATGASDGRGVPIQNAMMMWGKFQNIANSKGFIPLLSASDKSLVRGTAVAGKNAWLLNGVTASDVEDGDLTSKVSVSSDGGFDPNVNGVYPVTYSVTDSDGNVVTKTVNVTVYSDITVHYVDGSGTALQPVSTLPASAGGAYTVATPQLAVKGASYYFVSADHALFGTFGANGQPTDITLSYALDQTTVKAKDVSLYAGQSWDPAAGFVSAVGKSGSAVAFSGVAVSGSVDVKTPGSYKVTYALKNAAGVDVSAVSTVTVSADVAVIKAHGSTLALRGAWNPADNFDSAMNSDGSPVPLSTVTVSGAPKADKPGVYAVTYSFLDKAGFVESKTVNITVKAGAIPAPVVAPAKPASGDPRDGAAATLAGTGSSAAAAIVATTALVLSGVAIMLWRKHATR